ncbi:hypothetical protein SAMN05444920_115125 [Nonomuraea solani]|uniref:Fibronectin type-III domain-containing protein n=1 Tax=Nonomuraea solani TaxID=1144553 RepID=A0A1H6ET15_9ACTN|nr:hypothetical protein [Nonomuraea solani]SEH00146.1 hypothetical protein SAMN05444920_115125 [Nonomuraea solani]
MAFDEARYVREVLDPARRSGGLPPVDLRPRYQLTEGMSAAEVTETVRQVRQCWRRSRQLLKFRKLVDALEAEHAERYTEVFKAAAGGDLGPLRAHVAQAAERDGRRLADVRRRLNDAAGRLRMLPPDVVAGIATSAGLDAPAAVSIAAELDIEVREPDRLPQTPPYVAYPKVRAALDTLGRPHLAGFVFADAEIRIMGDLSGIPERVTLLEQEAQRRTRGPWTVSADMIFSALRNTPDAAALLRYDIAARLRERVREHPYDDTLLRHATGDLGLHPDDAKRLIFAIRQESGVAGGPLDRLRELIGAGLIQEAVDFAAALPPEALTGETAVLAAEARARLDTAVGLRDTARAEADPDRAWLMLEDALRRAPDLPGTEALLAGLAPRPPGKPQARLRGGVVAITWPPSPSRGGSVDYEVYRDGFPFAETTRPHASDERPPVNTPVTYAVAARRGQAVSAAVECAPLTFRPEPADLRLSAVDGVVTGHWRAPAEVLRVVVERDGVPIRVEGSGFRDRDVRNGTTYDYLVAAVYPDGRGEVTTPGLRRTVTPRAKPVPVAAFTVEPDAGGGELLVRCAEPPSGVLEFVLLAGEPRWPYGAVVPLDEVYAAGRVLPATPARDGYALRSAQVSGVLLAVTVAGESATIGAHREHVNLPAPRGVSAVRRGGTVHVGLEWPPGVPEIEVRWGERRLLVSSAAYRSGGGIRLDVPEAEAPAIRLTPTTLMNGRRVHGPAVRVPLSAVVPVRYSLRAEGPPWRRELVVDLSAERPVRVTRLLLVIKPGRVLPCSADDGRVLAEWSGLDPPARLSVPMPRQPKPYWLRCFAEGPVELVDPPVRVLKSG